MQVNLKQHWLLSGKIFALRSVTIFRLFPKKVELQALFKYYDIDGSGNVSFEEFMQGLR